MGGPGGFGGGSFSDIFGDVFGDIFGGGGGRGRGGPQRGSDLRYTLDISLEDAVRGTTVNGLTVSDNEFHHSRMTPIGGVNFSNVTITDNHMHSIHPWNFGGAGDHGDFVHFWTDHRYQSSGNSNYTITGNFFDQGDGTVQDHGFI